MARMSPPRTHNDPAIKGVELVLEGLDRLSEAMQNGLRKEFEEERGGLTVSVFVGTVKDDRGTRPANLPLWLEYGTRKMEARPFLIPAFEQERPRFEQATAKVLQDAAAKD